MRAKDLTQQLGNGEGGFLGHRRATFAALPLAMPEAPAALDNACKKIE